LLSFFSRSCHDNKLFSQWASRMAMARILHFVSTNNTVRPILDHNLIAFKKTFWHFIIITTSN
jgi:hypothetical protein